MFDLHKRILLYAISLFFAGSSTLLAQNPAIQSQQEIVLPSAHIAASGRPVKCGLNDAMFVHQNRATFSIAQQRQLEGYLARPQLQQSYISPSGVFKLHYNLDGVHGIDPTSTNDAGVPDWVYEGALAADSSYELIVNRLGFNPHLSDNGIDGPECDIFFVDTFEIFRVSYYGATVPESGSGVGFSAYLTIENDFAENFFTKGLDAVRVTIAHEYFHAVHFTHRYRDEDLFFWEMSAVWFEDRAYPEINDYFAYLPSFFRTMHQPLHTANGWHEYGAGIFLKYWLSLHGEGSLRTMWNELNDFQALRAIQNELNAKSSSFVEALAEFAGWCFFTGRRARPGRYFEDAAEFPTVTYRDQFDVTDEMSVTDSIRALSIQFFQFTVDASNDFSVSANDNGAGVFGLSGVSEQPSGELGELQVRGASVPYAISAMENDGLINLAVANGALPASAATNVNLLPRDIFNMRIALRALDPQPAGFLPPRPNPYIPGRHASVRVLYNLLEEADLHLKIVSEAGQAVLQENIGRRTQGLYSFEWDGKDADGINVASGIYFAILTTSAGDRFLAKIAVLR